MICLPRALPFHSRNNKKSNSRRQIVFNEILVSRLLKSSESKRERENWGGSRKSRTFSGKERKTRPYVQTNIKMRVVVLLLYKYKIKNQICTGGSFD